MRKSWFYRLFGFHEEDLGSFNEVRNQFEHIIPEEDPENTILRSRSNGEIFKVGIFETPSVQQLHKLHEEARATTTPQSDSQGITFKNIVGNIRSLILDSKNEGEVFQAASQFNCLEMIGPRVTPEMGVTCYHLDKTQGPACALACPAATIVRNYFAGKINGYGQACGNQLDMMKDVAKLLENAKQKYWVMRNGYLMPTNNFKLRALQKRLEKSKASKVGAKITSSLRVGVHWNTATYAHGNRGAEPHRVCQVLTSAVPVAYAKGTSKKDWEQLASAVLNGAYEATLAVGAVLAAKRGRRVTVYLTCVGGGAFGNSNTWIVSAIKRALRVWKHAPLDVRLVHHKSVQTLYKKIGTSTKRKRSSPKKNGLGT